ALTAARCRCRDAGSRQRQIAKRPVASSVSREKGGAMAGRIQHVFVLMLENRSFDHMLGFCSITGIDAASGGSTQVRGLNPLAIRSTVEAFGTNFIGDIVNRKGLPRPVSVRALLTSNVFSGQSYGVQQGADFAMPLDPGHEFPDVVMQLCGPGA